MDEIFEQLIECDKGKGRVKILQGLAIISILFIIIISYCNCYVIISYRSFYFKLFKLC